MRVITGSARGRRLETLEGEDVRPTTDRIKEAVLFLLCFLGGTIGGIIGVHALHHKTTRQAFVVGIPLILLVQVVTVIYCCLRLTVLNP